MPKVKKAEPRKRTRMRAVTGVIPPPVRERLEAIASDERRTVSQLVRIAIEDFVARHPAA